jgi:hypothetical protein
MLDPQVDAVRAMTDATAERIAILGVSPVGTPGALVEARTWDDYSLGRAGAIEHLGALEVVYSGVIEGHPKAIDATEDPDPVTQDLLIEQSGELELFHWFVRATSRAPAACRPRRASATCSRPPRRPPHRPERARLTASGAQRVRHARGTRAECPTGSLSPCRGGSVPL